jgi:hypothetical protein
MRRSLVALALVVLSASVACAQEWAEKLFVNRTHDFGTVARGTQLHHAIPVTNIYAVPIEITSIRAS